MPRSTVRLWLRPSLLGLHVLLVVAVTGCIVGGLWQYGSYENQQSQERVERAAMSPVPLQEVWAADEPFTTDLDHRRVEIRGEFGPTDQQVWVSGRHQDGQDGFWLLAPLVVEGGSEALLLVRGFAPRVGDLPPVPSGAQSVTAILRPSEGEGAGLDERRVVGTVRVPSLLNELGMPLYSGFAIATSRTGVDLALAKEPEPDVSWTVGLTNLAYALQWWAFALFAVFMWWRMCTDAVSDARAAASAPPPEPTPHDP